MIKGIGTDIVKVERIAQSIRRTENFLPGLFTLKEIDYFKSRKNNVETIAGTFAAKEAVSKALGTGFRGFRLKDIEIIHDELGKPAVNLSDKVITLFNLTKYKIHLTISHTSEDAIAFAILEDI
ncbi:holo-ACP synthase [Clostridium paraputrificum]|uniref:holo-ACP synthase n=1 Tax=Clostridium paraputrificum TaxID=29363 RepID=UPI003D33CFA7